MFPRLAFLIVCLGLIGASLLSLRQARLQAASEAAQAQLRIAAADEALFSLRAQVAAAVTPSSIEKLASSLRPMRPATNELPAEIVAERAQLEQAQLAQAEQDREELTRLEQERARAGKGVKANKPNQPRKSSQSGATQGGQATKPKDGRVARGP